MTKEKWAHLGLQVSILCVVQAEGCWVQSASGWGTRTWGYWISVTPWLLPNALEGQNTCFLSSPSPEKTWI